MKYLLPERAYTALKWLGLTALPSLAVFYGVVGPLWGWPAPEAVVTTINACGVLLGALVGYSAATAVPDDAKGADDGKQG